MVYIDDMNAPYRGMIMCHMIADSTEELLDMVETIGVNIKWIQRCLVLTMSILMYALVRRD